jgi:hypothetical protein
MSIQVIDNCLNDIDFKTIQETLISQNFPWFFLPSKVGDLYGDQGLNDCQFTHMFYKNYSPNSKHIDLVDPILKVLNPSAIVKIKANLTTVSSNIIEFPLHTDVEHFDGTTAIYYVNSNNGYTYFESGERVESVGNRLVIFDSTLKHAGTTSTDTKYRSLINFNYYNWK